MSSSPAKSPPAAARGVQLPDGVSASRLLHDLLLGAAARFPELHAARIPRDASRFRRDFAETLVRFEAARVGSPSRAAIAAHVADGAYHAFRFVADDGTATTLAERMAAGAAPYPVRRVALTGAAGVVPRVEYRGEVYEGAALGRLADELVRRQVATRAAAAALGALGRAGPLVLSGRRFAVLGAAAELSPATLLLAAGAEVLWLDRTPPPPALLAAAELAGAITYVEEGIDLLAAPDRVAATLAEFAADGGAHLILSAYAPGGGREWRLAAAMNAIARAIDPARVQGVGVYISPTTPCVVESPGPDTVARPAWQRALAAAGALKPSPLVRDHVRIARALVPIQGVSYQAAQYVEKTLASERFAALGLRDGTTPPRVSANVAPITATRSLEHPLFQAGFLGAARFGVEIFQPDTTRALGALLLLADLVGPAAAKDDVSPTLPSGRHVHGGVHAMAYALDEAIRVAAVLGLAERPALLGDLVRRRMGGGRPHAS